MSIHYFPGVYDQAREPQDPSEFMDMMAGDFSRDPELPVLTHVTDRFNIFAVRTGLYPEAKVTARLALGLAVRKCLNIQREKIKRGQLDWEMPDRHLTIYEYLQAGLVHNREEYPQMAVEVILDYQNRAVADGDRAMQAEIYNMVLAAEFDENRGRTQGGRALRPVLDILHMNGYLPPVNPKKFNIA